MNREEFDFKDLTHLLDHMQISFLTCDQNHIVMQGNQAACSALGLPLSDLIGADLFELVREREIPNSACVQAFYTRQLSTQYICKGLQAPILSIADPVLDSEGNISSVTMFGLTDELIELMDSFIAEYRKNVSLNTDHFLAEAPVTIIAKSPEMLDILSLLQRIAPTDSTILLTGETGTGKEVLAKSVHTLSARSDKIFIPVNCAAIPENLMESEFFGYAKGAFTGANKEGKAGVFELADGGTLFLDEIGELPLSIQSKFLRVIETGEITRLGAGSSKKVDVRLIAATNRDLKDMCANGTFRSDLFYRLNILSLEIPPLRKRPKDIIPLAAYFLKQLNQKYSKTKILSVSAIQELERHDWPGNVRELRNIIERLFVLSTGDILKFERSYNTTFPSDTPSSVNVEPQAFIADDSPEVPEDSLHNMVAAYEKKLVLKVLENCNGNVSKAAQQLQLHKSVLYRKLEKYRENDSVPTL